MDRDNVFLLCLSSALAVAGFSYLVSFLSARAALRFGAIDQPTGGRKIHRRATPLWGGLGIAKSILVALFILGVFGRSVFHDLRNEQLIGFMLAILVLSIGGMIDDWRPLPARIQFIFPFLAAFIVIATGTGIVQVTDPRSGGGLVLEWWRFGSVSLPSDLVTLTWLLVATYATKFLDGLDGLVSGMAVIGSAMVGALTLSPTYYQPGVAVLASLVGGGFLGFLPRNIHPAKQFLGEAGSTLAGFSLGFLAIISSAKVAIALAVLAIPVTDAIVVVLGRIVRGAPPWKGDDTHLHFRLLQAGIPHRRAVVLLWAVSFAAGVTALGLQTRGKFFLVAMLMVLTVLGSWFANRVASKRITSL
jgi:UDP-GlcNAc:undecaprenyl-phosphate GlcNAc-1-phosphate transferase